MCQISLLVIGDSSMRNAEALNRVQVECQRWGEDINIALKVVTPYEPGTVNPNEHDLALVDESVISKGCSRTVLGSGLPILAFGDFSSSEELPVDAKFVLSNAVGVAVRMGRLRDYIEKVTDQIDATRHMIEELA